MNKDQLDLEKFAKIVKIMFVFSIVMGMIFFGVIVSISGFLGFITIGYVVVSALFYYYLSQILTSYQKSLDDKNAELKIKTMKVNQDLSSVDDDSNLHQTVDQPLLEKPTYRNSLLWIPNTYTTITKEIMDQYPDVTKVFIPVSVTRFEDESFYNSSKLRSVVIDSGCGEIELGNHVFSYQNSSLKIYLDSKAYNAYIRNSKWLQYSHLLVLENR